MGNALNIALRRKLEERRAIIVPGAPNALAARIMEDIGFEAIYLTGAGIANSFLGVPDIGLLTMTELADHVVAIRDSVSLPIIVDADTGFGNALNVHRVVRVLERAGANAIQIEDQVFPKKCGHFAGKQVVSLDEMVQKVRAAADARNDANLIIVARTDARAITGFDDAIERAMAYVEAGADVSFVEAPTSIEELEKIPRLIGAPQVYNAVVGGLTPLVDIDGLRNMGFGMTLYANAALQAAVFGMASVLKTLHRDGDITAVTGQLASFEERQRLVGKPAFDALERRYAERVDQSEA